MLISSLQDIKNNYQNFLENSDINDDEEEFDENMDYSEAADTSTDTMEGDQLICEAVLAEELSNGANIDEFDIDNIMNETGLLLERSIVRLDRVAKKNQAIVKAAVVIAKEKKSRFFKILQKSYVAKRYALSNIMKQYGAAANTRVNRIKRNSTVKSILRKKGVTNSTTKDIKRTNNNSTQTFNHFGANSLKVPKGAENTRRFRFNK